MADAEGCKPLWAVRKVWRCAIYQQLPETNITPNPESSRTLESTLKMLSLPPHYSRLLHQIWRSGLKPSKLDYMHRSALHTWELRCGAEGTCSGPSRAEPSLPVLMLYLYSLPAPSIMSYEVTYNFSLKLGFRDAFSCSFISQLSHL